MYTSNSEKTDASYSITNGAGLEVSRQVGFGVMDAEAMVTRARHWINVPPLLIEEITSTTTSGYGSNMNPKCFIFMQCIKYFISVYSVAVFESPFMASIPYNGSIQYLEQVVATMTVATTSGNRRDIRIELTSPSGTQSTLLNHRNNDFSASGYFGWPFMSVMFWGEYPIGEWNLTVTTRSPATVLSVSGVVFRFFGTDSIPESVANIPATCHPNCSRGCAGEGSDTCDSCVNLRNVYTLECIDECPAGYTERNGYCYDTTLTTEECFSPLKIRGRGENWCVVS